MGCGYPLVIIRGLLTIVTLFVSRFVVVSYGVKGIFLCVKGQLKGGNSRIGVLDTVDRGVLAMGGCSVSIHVLLGRLCIVSIHALLCSVSQHLNGEWVG